MLIREYFFIIMATISVPPLDAPILNRIAELNAGRAIAKISSSIGSLVNGSLKGKTCSRKLRPTDINTLTYVVIMPNPLPRKTNPSTSNNILITRLMVPALNGTIALNTIAIPDTPPKEKLFGNLKTYMPLIIISDAKVNME